ncbi:hypothetical protein GCM10027277_02040 [Pseudoduganella ginsengisoli]|uniref:Uncharacterized protein n=1 Tax=Pseudoduganella ginsengisoli TaxID=1462440 RepID=A0A6L6Q4K2_9BURK|nr:hypothetical protein [Pseudoduganella ginsengisoli]MTW04640.1 hypothetical protein [Pseudoduganella ginsengisoli]
MNTFPILNSDCAHILAFEIEHPYITMHAITRLLATTEGVTDVRLRRLERDFKIEFKFRSLPYVVWEPHGADGRYWIGPDAETPRGADVAALRTTFERYRPSALRMLYGSLVSSLQFTGLSKKRHNTRRTPLRVS